MAIAQSARPWLSMTGRRRLPVVRQSTATECGLACVEMLASYFGTVADLVSLRRSHGVSAKGATLASIIRCCAALGLSTRAVRCDVPELGQLRTPCILHWRFNHFVVLESVRAGHIVIHDPARGVVHESMSVAKEAFTGVALEVGTVQPFKATPRLPKLKLRGLVSLADGLREKFVAGLLLALVCEVLLLATPFYLQLIIDQVLAKGDVMLLNTLLVAFSVLLLINVLANVMRQLTFHYLGHVSVFDVTTRVLHRLLQLSVRFFRSRELGDIQHRVQSLSRIQAFLVQSLPALVLDSLFVVLITILMFVYDAALTALMLAALLAWCVWRRAIFSLSLRLSNDIAQSESSVQTHLLETLRAVQSIKLTNGESQRELEWRNLFADVTNSRIRVSNLQVVDGAVRQVLFQGARVATVFFLARRGLDGQISIGMISAYVAYLGMFTTRGCGIVDRVLEYKLLDVPLNRLADIVFAEEESTTAATGKRSLGDIELVNIGFSYSNDDAPILRECSATFGADRLTAVAGPSGVGKSTLLQLLAGIEQPCRGDILIDGGPAKHWASRDLRSMMAAVFQDDVLLKGSIASNIALSAATIDPVRVRDAAASACIAAEIEALPMTYETRIGDLGSALSKGQVQRILLARAFYRRPSLLLLDEVTSGLDVELEKKVIASIARMNTTTIVVTHSDLMLQAADAVLWLHEGRLQAARPDYLSR